MDTHVEGQILPLPFNCPLCYWVLSAYDMKNIFRSFERPFKIQNNGVFLFEISIFVSEILTFFYYANYISDDVILCTPAWEVAKHWINDISGINIEAVFLKFGTTKVHHKRNKMAPLMLLPWQQFGHWCCLNKN